MEDLEFRIAKLALGANDILVVKCLTQITVEKAGQIKDQFHSLIGHKHVIVFGPEIELSVLTRAEIEARAAA